MIIAEGLVKVFPTVEGTEKRAVDGLTFQVRKGETYGLLGPNGAGKTTTLRLLSGLIKLTAGRAILNGYDVARYPHRVKRSIGFLTASTGLYQRLSARELLQYFGALQGLQRDVAKQRAEELIDLLEMHDFAHLRCGSFSTGQRQRTSIARALVANPPILILDEPTLGLDVLTNRVMLNFIRQEGRQGKTILLSTHYLDEAESMCHRFGLLHEGRLIVEGTLPELRAQTGRERLSDIFLQMIESEQESADAAAHQPAEA